MGHSVPLCVDKRSDIVPLGAGHCLTWLGLSWCETNMISWDAILTDIELFRVYQAYHYSIYVLKMSGQVFFSVSGICIVMDKDLLFLS